MNFLSSKKGMSPIVGLFATIIGLAAVLFVSGVFMAYQADIVEEVADDLGVSGCAARTDTMVNYNESSNLCYNSTHNGSSALPVNTYAHNVTQDNLAATADLSDKQDTLTGVGVAVIIIALLIFAAGVAGIRLG